MTTTSPRLGLDDVVAAREVIEPIVLRTPVLRSRVLSERIGGPVYLKCKLSFLLGGKDRAGHGPGGAKPGGSESAGG
jgi:hypothetical protein